MKTGLSSLLMKWFCCFQPQKDGYSVFSSFAKSRAMDFKAALGFWREGEPKRERQLPFEKKLSTCITDTRSVFIEIVRFFHFFRKITVTYFHFWRL